MKPLNDLAIIGIRDPNTPEERVLIQAINPTSLEWYLLINTKLTKDGMLDVLNDHVFWFPTDITVKKDEFIRIYTTKVGEYNKGQAKYGKKDAIFHNFFWGLKKPIWDMTTSDAVTLFHVDNWNTMVTG